MTVGSELGTTALGQMIPAAWRIVRKENVLPDWNRLFAFLLAPDARPPARLVDAIGADDSVVAGPPAAQTEIIAAGQEAKCVRRVNPDAQESRTELGYYEAADRLDILAMRYPEEVAWLLDRLRQWPVADRR
jgi:hypothetical protein